MNVVRRNVHVVLCLKGQLLPIHMEQNGSCSKASLPRSNHRPHNSMLPVVSGLKTGDCSIKAHTDIVHNSIINISKEKTFLQDFLDILKQKLQNLSKILKKCSLVTTRLKCIL